MIIRLGFATLLLLLISCSDDIVNNYYGSEAGSITGYINPPDPGTRISIDGGTTFELADERGFFILTNLQPGIYDLTIDPANYTKRSIRGLTITPGKTHNLDEVVLSTFPYPIYEVQPEDGAENVYSPTQFVIYADEQLNLDDLRAGISIDPPIEITDIRDDDYRLSTTRYSVRFKNRLALGTTYRVTISGDVRTAAGIALGEDIAVSFTTQAMTVYVDLPPQGAMGGVTLRTFQPVLRFGDCVDAEAISRAVDFIPAIEGIWLPQFTSSECEKQNHYRSYSFFPTSPPLLAETNYLLIVSDQEELTDGVYLPRADTTSMTTEPYGVTSLYPKNATTNVSTNIYVELRFNVPMDTASVETAFALTPSVGGQPSGIFTWSSSKMIMNYYPDDHLLGGTVYTITVGTHAQLATGENVTREFVSYFQTR